MDWLKKLIGQKCLSIHFDTDGNVCALLVRLDSKGNLFVEEEFSNLDSVLTYLGSNPRVPIAVSLESEDIIYSWAEEELNDENVLDLLRHEIPGFNLDDFLVCYYDSYFGFARKSSVSANTSILSDYVDQIVLLGFGAVPSFALANVLYEDKFYGVTIGKYQFEMGHVKEVSPSDFDLESVHVKSGFVSSFTLAISYFQNNLGVLGYPFLDNQENLQFEELLHRLFRPVLFTLLALLMINTGLFFYMNDKYRVLSEQSVIMQNLNARRNELVSYVNANERIVKLSKHNAEKAIICDQLGGSIPNSVTLTRLVISPRSIDRTSTEVFLTNKVELNGVATDLEAFALWVNHLENQPWVLKVEAQKLTEANGINRFELTLIRDVEES